jgi:hypothetical protein
VLIVLVANIIVTNVWMPFKVRCPSHPCFLLVLSSCWFWVSVGFGFLSVLGACRLWVPVGFGCCSLLPHSSHLVLGKSDGFVMQ